MKPSLISVLSSRIVSAAANRLTGVGGPAIFMLHRIDHGDSDTGGITAGYLRTCLEDLRHRGVRFVALSEVFDALQEGTSLPPDSVAFCMDDGFADQAQLAAPIFEEHGCPVTFFVITGLLDGTLWPWDDQLAYLIAHSLRDTIEMRVGGYDYTFSLADPPSQTHARRTLRDAFKLLGEADLEPALKALEKEAGVEIPANPPPAYRPMDWDTARVLERRGVRFAPHSVTHRILSRLSRESMEAEITQSWARLQDELSAPLPVFCYPTGRVGDFGKREIDLLRDLGFTGAVSTTPGYLGEYPGSALDPYRVPRFELPASLTDFRQYSSWIERLKRRLI